MATPSDLTRLVPGFEFLQNLMKGAGAAVPGMGQWIAPTINPEELEKRISELKTVQFWLENNARLLATTIQALEVQRMTLSTLQSMNLPLTDLRDLLKINLPTTAQAEPEAAAPAKKATPRAADLAGGKDAPAAVDPMQWWGALTQQFSELATKVMKDSATDTARTLAGAAVKQAVASAGSKLAKAASLPAQAASTAAAAAKRASRAGRKRSG